MSRPVPHKPGPFTDPDHPANGRPEDPQIRAALAEIANGNYPIAIAWLHEARRIREAYANAPAMVNVPILRYSDPCPHGYLTYELDGVTFHRATLGACNPNGLTMPQRSDHGIWVETE
jgi:hypothetical protein